MVARKDGKPRVFDSVKKKSRFLIKARKTHGDKYEYPDDYADCKQAIRIICQIHGEFYQTPDAHIQGKGCSKCRINKGGVRYSNQEMVNRFNQVHKGLYDYSHVDYKNAHTKVGIICREHGLFYQEPNVHLQGSGCPKCAGKLITEDDFIKMFNEKGLVNIEYVGGFVNTISLCNFFCKKHGEFSCKPTQYFNSKHGCRLCANEGIGKSLALGLDEIIAGVEETGLFQVISVDNSDHYSYNTNSEVTVKCLRHRLIETRPYTSLIKSIGCSECLYENKVNLKLYTKDKFVTLAKDVHGDVYDYSCVEYKRANIPVDVICQIHGKFSLTPSNHLEGQKCPNCTVKNSWSREGFIRFVESNYDGLSTIYFIRCYNDVENFVKVGHTCRTLKARFSTKREMPYNYDVIFQMKTDAASVYDIEKSVKEVFKIHDYLPNQEFGGKTECFKIEKQFEILDYIKEKLCLSQSN